MTKYNVVDLNRKFFLFFLFSKSSCTPPGPELFFSLSLRRLALYTEHLFW